MGRLDGTVAIITGAARGQGEAEARLFVEEGASVLLADVRDEQGEAVAESLGERAMYRHLDVSHEEDWTTAVAEAERRFGPPTVLVNNAGITRDNLLFKMTVDEWDAVIAVHLRGSFLMTKAAQKYMTEATFGRIVNLSSTSALGNRGQVNYSAAKAGIQGFTKTLAVELGKFGITANAIAPGFIETEMTAATAERLGVDFEDFKKFNAEQIPVARVGQPEDIAHTVSFLVSEGAGFVSGQVIYVAGGPKA
jgi:3-oxoacyl-[acyl-carrier protein] reductase